MNNQIENIRASLSEALTEVASIQDPLTRLNSAIEIIEENTKELNQLIHDEPFKTDTDEIRFFKVIRPDVYSHKIEEGMRYKLIINRPIQTSEAQINYYEEELKALQSFFRMYAFHYQYYKNGFTELDHLYFLKTSAPSAVPLPELTELEEDSSRPLSHLFAKFIAYERLQYFILSQISLLKEKGNPIIKGAGEESLPELKWTGDGINLVEVIYGIWLTGQLNDGNASLNQIVRWFEAHLKVKVGIVQKRFGEIERRKRLSITKFIDRMKEAIIKKIENLND